MSSKDYYNMMDCEAALQNKSIAANDEAFGLINNYTDWQREGLRDLRRFIRYNSPYRAAKRHYVLHLRQLCTGETVL